MQQLINTNKRNPALDALRGVAILGMVFSGAFPHELPWPGWMFHAQVGPPDFTYKPEVPGISWVDLVFPFFLFAMGAAIPLSMEGKLSRQSGFDTCIDILKRFLLLVFFAITIRHLNPYLLKGPQWFNHITALLAFGAFFLVFMPLLQTKYARVLKMAGFFLLAILLWIHQYYFQLGFSIERSDIIILVLANMALFGTFIWWSTRGRVLLRIAILAVVAGIRLAHDVPGSWNETVWQFHPSIQWLYRFDFLKYLFIVVPGTMLGEYLLKKEKETPVHKKDETGLAVVSILLVVVNLYGLYTRQLLLNAGVSVVLIAIGNFKWKHELFGAASCWLLIGLSFEALDGGIKKDPSSFSYWFVASGLALFTYIFLDNRLEKRTGFWGTVLASCGQNPMVAYVAGSFLVWPVLDLLRIKPFIDAFREINVYAGIVKTIILTGAVVWVTAFTVRKKWFWKT
ncbi:MAG: DUF5009 domain-containing protein [Chitinophagaceae bacterium]